MHTTEHKTKRGQGGRRKRARRGAARSRAAAAGWPPGWNGLRAALRTSLARMFEPRIFYAIHSPTIRYPWSLPYTLDLGA